MIQLREKVAVKTATGELHGELFIGADGLPELRLDVQFDNESFRPGTLPAAWIVISHTCGTLYSAWDLIWNLIEEIAIAQREAEEEKPCRQGDGYVSHDFIGFTCIRCGVDECDHAQQREMDNRIAQEVDERRDDERLNETHKTA